MCQSTKELEPFYDQSLLSVSSIRRAREYLSMNFLRMVVWEEWEAEPLVSNGEWDVLHRIEMPWPSLVVASTEALFAKAGAIRKFLEWASAACTAFAEPEKAERVLAFLYKRQGLSVAAACALIARTTWTCDAVVDEADLARPLECLIDAGLLSAERACSTSRLVARQICEVTNACEEPHLRLVHNRIRRWSNGFEQEE